MKLAKNSLEIKRKVIEWLAGQGLYPYSEFYLHHLLKRTAATFSYKVHITTFPETTNIFFMQSGYMLLSVSEG